MLLQQPTIYVIGGIKEWAEKQLKKHRMNRTGVVPSFRRGCLQWKERAWRLLEPSRARTVASSWTSPSPTGPCSPCRTSPSSSIRTGTLRKQSLERTDMHVSAFKRLIWSRWLICRSATGPISCLLFKIWFVYLISAMRRFLMVVLMSDVTTSNSCDLNLGSANFLW